MKPSQWRAPRGSCIYGVEAKESICAGNINLDTISICLPVAVEAIGLVWNVKDKAKVRTWKNTQECGAFGVRGAR